jgi:hypothetical protein
MKKTIEETTRLLMQGTLTKDEADKILLDLHSVSNQRELLLAYDQYCDKMKELYENPRPKSLLRDAFLSQL